MSLGALVSLFARRHYSKRYEWIGMKFYGEVAGSTVKILLNFGGI